MVPSVLTATSRLLACVIDINNWMSSNRLKLNGDSIKELTVLPHFALNDPSYSPYDVTYDVIGNPPLLSLLPLEVQLGLP